ncbi:hypothetical protein LUZ61_016073 [Rhynchospora tenuis]|uniref:Uncharacterized protein n=1 Tax=Rhynchospora tenuis TaxID=198213 RepID=A0AAD5Z4V3_9POAL|nr:hypothetical protein LUZ61_016073 [Rhynchospora tenuis]
MASAPMDLEKGGSSSNRMKIQSSLGGRLAPDLASISNEAGRSRDVTDISIGETIPRVTNCSNATSCFQRLPSNATRLRLLNQRNTVPMMVAIGPYHQACEGLYFSKKYKERVLRWMIQVFSLDENNFLNEMSNKRNDIVQQNNDLGLADISVEEFSKMLLLDSCFIFFILKRLGCGLIADVHEAIKGIQVQGDHAQLRQETSFLASDIFTHQEEIRVDLIMHENQIPFSVINDLLETYPVLKNFIDERSIEDLALLFFSEVYPKQNTDLNQHTKPKFLHLLHLFHWSRVPNQRKYAITKRERYRRPFVSSATELQHSGITFKRKNLGSFIDITFDEGCLKILGTINIPVIHINEYNGIIFYNLLAFEQKNTEFGGCFTAYSAWLAHLLQSEEDVKLFRKNRIVPNTPTPDNEVVQFFQDLKTESEITNLIPELYELFKMVRDHNEGTLNQCYGAFKLKYCSNFWITLGVVLFGVVTLVQTTFTVLSYFATLSGNKKN